MAHCSAVAPSGCAALTSACCSMSVCTAEASPFIAASASSLAAWAAAGHCKNAAAKTPCSTIADRTLFVTRSPSARDSPPSSIIGSGPGAGGSRTARRPSAIVSRKVRLEGASVELDDLTSGEVRHGDPARRPGEVLGAGVPDVSAEDDDVTRAGLDPPGLRMPCVGAHQALGRNPPETMGSGNEASGAVRLVHIVEHPEGVGHAVAVRPHRLCVIDMEALLTAALARIPAANLKETDISVQHVRHRAQHVGMLETGEERRFLLETVRAVVVAPLGEDGLLQATHPCCAHELQCAFLRDRANVQVARFDECQPVLGAEQLAPIRRRQCGRSGHGA